MKIFKANLDHVDLISPLFDLYRQFYQQAPNAAGARAFIHGRLKNDESVIFVALDNTGRAMGFTQLYATFCSVALAPKWILYDLYVDVNFRKESVGRSLMNAAREMAETSGAQRIDLETAISNTNAQQLYESLAYVRDTHFYAYSLTLIQP